jgi:hypothetical protein
MLNFRLIWNHGRNIYSAFSKLVVCPVNRTSVIKCHGNKNSVVKSTTCNAVNKLAEKQCSQVGITEQHGIPLFTRYTVFPSLSFTAPYCVHQKLKHSDLTLREIYPPLDEEELEETFVCGRGPGGQAVNKTSNCVVLKHQPTGIVIKCHETRSLHENRRLARIHLQQHLDFYVNGRNCVAERLKEEARKIRQKREVKTKNRLDKLSEFKHREGLD